VLHAHWKKRKREQEEDSSFFGEEQNNSNRMKRALSFISGILRNSSVPDGEDKEEKRGSRAAETTRKRRRGSQASIGSEQGRRGFAPNKPREKQRRNAEEDSEGEENENVEDENKRASLFLGGVSVRPARSTVGNVEFIDLEAPVRLLLPSSKMKPDLKRVVERAEEEVRVLEESQAKRTSSSRKSSSTGSRRKHGVPLVTDSGLVPPSNSAKAIPIEYDADSEDEEFLRELGRNIDVDDFETMVEMAEMEEHMTKMFAWTEASAQKLEMIEHESDSVLQKLGVKDLPGKITLSVPIVAAEDAGKEKAKGNDKGLDEDEESETDDSVHISVEDLQRRFQRCVRNDSGSSGKPQIYDGIMYPLSHGNRLPASCAMKDMVKKFHKYWSSKRQRDGPLTRRFQRSDLLANWSISDAFADEFQSTEQPFSMSQRGALAMLHAMDEIRDDLLMLEQLTGMYKRVEELRLKALRGEDVSVENEVNDDDDQDEDTGEDNDRGE